MIFDKIKNLSSYEEIIKDADAIIGFLEKVKNENIREGRFEIDGKRLFAMVQDYETKAKDGCRPEAHRSYADLQVMLAGREYIGWAETDDLTLAREEFSKGGDIAFYDGDCKLWLPLEEGYFAFLLPQDAHMPCIKISENETAWKVVFKILI